MDELTAIIERAWGWTGLHPVQVLERNAFGNLLVLDRTGRCWRICPEDLSRAVVAGTAADLAALRTEADFQMDWEMTRLRDAALKVCGPISDTRAYCLKIPAVLGGKYDASNIASLSLFELISVSGHLAFQIKDLPDGAAVSLRTVE